MTQKKPNPPAMTFGSKEWNEYYRLRHGSKATGDKATRARKGLKQSLTKKGEAKHLESQRKELEKEGAKLARAQKAEDRAEARILGPGGKTHAVKVAKPSGTFGPEDVQAFAELGWEVHPAGSVSAKTGLSLGAIEPWDAALNPEPDYGRILGPQQAARAMVLAHPEAVITADTLHQLRTAGYDVAAAPKALREGRKTSTNPPGPEKRVYAALISAAKRGDSPTLEDLAQTLHEPEEDIQTRLGSLARQGLAHPVEGGLFGCGWAPGVMAPALAFNPSGHLAPGADMHSGRKPEPGIMTKTLTTSEAHKALKDLERTFAAVLSKETKGAVEVCSRGEDLWTVYGEPEAVRKAVAFLQSHKLMTLESQDHDKELGTTFAYLRSGKAKTNPTKSGRGAASKPAARAAQAAKKAPRPETSKVQPLKSSKADRYRAEKAVDAILDQAMKLKAAKKTAKPKGTLESATLKIRFNPGSVSDVKRVWEAWTGAKPGQVLKLHVDDPTGTVPEDVALLGRVSRFIQPDGALKDFGESGPLLVTDGQAKHVWMIHPKGFQFDLTPSVICYLARKPKFGDQGLIEYVHAFDRPAKARMEGQVGTLTGGFKLTPRGIEG